MQIAEDSITEITHYCFMYTRKSTALDSPDLIWWSCMIIHLPASLLRSQHPLRDQHGVFNIICCLQRSAFLSISLVVHAIIRLDNDRLRLIIKMCRGIFSTLTHISHGYPSGFKCQHRKLSIFSFFPRMFLVFFLHIW